MRSFYYEPSSGNARRVWIALIEKGLEFELIEVDLDGEQFSPEFMAINPLSKIPVLVDEGMAIVESLAILDYLEAQYPTPALLPSNPKDLAIVKMVILVTVNELFPAMNPLIAQLLELMNDAAAIDRSTQKIHQILAWMEDKLDDRPFFGSEQLTFAETVAGTVIPYLPMLNVSIAAYPKLNAWLDRLLQRPSWQATDRPITPEVLDRVKRRFMAQMGGAAGESECLKFSGCSSNE